MHSANLYFVRSPIMNSVKHYLLTDALSATELMVVGTVRSLDLLGGVDGAIQAKHYADLFNAAKREFTKARLVISSEKNAIPIPEDNLIPLLESLQDKLVKVFPTYQKKMNRAIDSRPSHGSYETVDTYERLLVSLATLNGIAESLRWSILESNANAESGHEPKILSKPEEIDSFLDSL